MAKNKSNIFMNTLVLLVITFICVAILAVVNQVTRTPIEQAEVNARAQTYREVFPDAENFVEIDGTDKLIENAYALLSSAGYDGCYINDTMSVTDSNGNIAGYVVAATSPNGYGGDVQIAIGISSDGVITGFQPISHSETPGFGAKCEEDEFKDQFNGMKASAIEYSKTGKSKDNEIDAISGATRSTNAITQAVNSAIIFYQENFVQNTDNDAK